MMDINIRPPGVIDTAHEMALLADTASRTLGTGVEGSKSAAVTHSGWLSSGPLTECARIWEDHLRDLVGQLNQLGQMLLTSGRDYTAADSEAERRVLEVLHELSGT